MFKITMLKDILLNSAYTFNLRLQNSKKKYYLIKFHLIKNITNKLKLKPCEYLCF